MITPAMPGWTAVIVNYNGAGFLDACLAALSATSSRPHDIIVVDNASSDDSLQELHAFPRAHVLAQRHNLGFAGGANVGLAAVETEYALLLNPDVEVATDFGNALLSAFAIDVRVGAIGSLLLYPDGTTIQHAGGLIQRPLMTTRHDRYGETEDGSLTRTDALDFVTGGAIALRMAAFRDVDGFDEHFSPVYYEDVDLCLRLRDAGWNVVFDPRLRALHHEGVTLERSAAYYRHLHRNRLRFALRHLTPAEWREEFVPAEFARLRYELATLSGEAWFEKSGADSVEALLRHLERPASWGAGPLISGLPPNALGPHIDSLRELWELRDPYDSQKPSFSRRVLRRLAGLGLRHGMDAMLARQREFNAAVVRSIETQDVLNREQAAALFLIAIDALGELRFSDRQSRTDDPQVE
jgi:GT2 family glycosyltransferase